MPGWMKLIAWIKIARRNINNHKYADDTTLMEEGEEKLFFKRTLDESERGEWNIWLKLHIQKMKIMAFGHITSWQIDGETMETMRDVIFRGSKITIEDDCSHEIKRCLLVWRKSMRSLAAFLKAETLLCWKSSIYSKLWFFQLSCMDVTVAP